MTGLQSINDSDIAIIGMSCRFPGAANIDDFWKNIRDGVESISFFSDEELIASGIEPAALKQPNYVKARAVLSNIELFDAAFFDFSPREAEITDPQHRIFLECAWDSLENAGYALQNGDNVIGVYAGVSMNTYLLDNLYSNRDDFTDTYSLLIGNDKDFLPTRVSYKLNLRGPSIDVQTACSTSLVAVHLACQSLLNGECDITLAGGVAITPPQVAGYLHQEGMINSPDGHCRAFDARAKGTVGGNGVGIVVLKRLEKALADGDHIHAVIKGSAINNDGFLKVGYTAPSVEGQTAVISEAQAIADIEAETISYIETHGTGTEIGDPIEIAALTKAFLATTEKKGFCAIDSLKTNIGHTGAAAGAAGLIKTVLALKHRLLPPSLHFEHPNPQIDFADSPFYVNRTLSEWKSNGTPRRAGVSSFGIGGTNAHVVLEEAPPREPSVSSPPWHLLALSAKTNTALQKMTVNLVRHLKENPRLNPADAAYTLQVGRKQFQHRRTAVCRDIEAAVNLLEAGDETRVSTHVCHQAPPAVAFMFPGTGDQYVNMSAGLYREEPVFRETVDRCSAILRPLLGADLKDILYREIKEERGGPRDRPRFDLRGMLNREPGETDEFTRRLNRTRFVHPAVFTIEYALASLWISWGIEPRAMIGYSLGEYSAACLAGVMSLEDTLMLVARRAELIEALPGGVMLAIPLPEQGIHPMLGEELSLAIVNTPSLCVAAGPEHPMRGLEEELKKNGVITRRLQTSHAFHSKMMAPVKEEFGKLFKTVELSPPKIPYISNVTGTWIKEEEAVSPSYWVNHTCRTVRFSEGIGRLLADLDAVLLEVGPGQTLAGFALQHQDKGKGAPRRVMTSLPGQHENREDRAVLLDTLGRLWLDGIDINWQACHRQEKRRRVPLPTYPFEGRRYWIEPGNREKPTKTLAAKTRSSADWFYLPTWKQSPLMNDKPAVGTCCLVFSDAIGLGPQLAKQLEQEGVRVAVVIPGERFGRAGDGEFILDPRDPHHYGDLFKELEAAGMMPGTVIHLWSVSRGHEELTPAILENAHHLGFYSLHFLVLAAVKVLGMKKLEIVVISNNLHEVSGDEHLAPEKAPLIGHVNCIPQEFPGFGCRHIDILIPGAAVEPGDRLVEQIMAELKAETPDRFVALRGRRRWTRDYEPFRHRPKNKDATSPSPTWLRERGNYMITGGLGRLGIELAKYMAAAVNARLVLTTRSLLPPKDQWEKWLSGKQREQRISRRIRKLKELETLGVEFIVVRAEAADEQQMGRAIAAAEKQFGPLNGVIHAAGIIKGNSIDFIENLGKPQCEEQFKPKIHGLMVLERRLKGKNLDFCLLLSSLSTILGGLNLLAYSAANQFMDAFVYLKNRNSTFPWISVNWEGWHFAEEEEPQENTPEYRERMELSMTRREVVEAFEKLILMKKVDRIVISKGSLEARINKWVKLESLRNRDIAGKEGPSGLEPGPGHPRPPLAVKYKAPGSGTEQRLVSIWQEVLRLGEIGIHDSFLELGGNSLLAIQVIAYIGAAFSITMSIRNFIQRPTIAELAVFIDRVLKDTGQTEMTSIPPAEKKEYYPLSSNQEGIFLLQRMNPRETGYNLPTLLLIMGPLDLEKLRQTFIRMIQRHEILRTSFVFIDTKPAQKIHEPGDLDFSVKCHQVPLSEETSRSRDGETRDAKLTPVEETIVKRFIRPFDLEKAPLLRVELILRDRETCVMMIDMHHLVTDGISTAILVNDFMACYQNNPLPNLIRQYKDFSQWQDPARMKKEETFWLKQFQGEIPRLNMPLDYPRPPVKDFRGDRVSLIMEKSLGEKVADFVSKMETTLFAVLFSVFQVLISKHSGQHDIVIGTPVTGRRHFEIQHVVGMFVNMLPLRNRPENEMTFREFLERVEENSMDAFDNQDYPFDVLVRKLKLQGDTHKNPLFEIAFNMQNIEVEPIKIDRLKMIPCELTGTTCQFDMVLHAVRLEHAQLRLTLEYSTSLFKRATVETILRGFCEILEQGLQNPGRQLKEMTVSHTFLQGETTLTQKDYLEFSFSD